MQAGHWGFIKYRPQKKPEYRPNIDHTALYRPNILLFIAQKVVKTVFVHYPLFTHSKLR